MSFPFNAPNLMQIYFHRGWSSTVASFCNLMKVLCQQDLMITFLDHEASLVIYSLSKIFSLVDKEKMGSGGGESMNWDGSSHISKSAKGSRRWGKKGSREEKGMLGERSVRMEKKRVMVMLDQSGKDKEAMMWALTHVANKGDLLTLLHVLPPHDPHRGGDSDLHNLAWSLGAQCKSCKPEF